MNTRVEFTRSGSRNVRRTADYVVWAMLVGTVLCRTTLAGPEIPGADQKQPIALVGGIVHPMSGPAIVGGTVLFEQGRITAVGKEIKLPESVKKIDVTGKHVYPGMFDALTNMGLIEINSVRATVDDSEGGLINPNVRALVAVNPDSEIIPTTRSNGVLLALTAPRGPLLAGRSSVIQLDGWTWEDMAVRSDVALHITWPNMLPVAEFFGGAPAKEQMDARDKALVELRRAFEQAEAYRVARRASGSSQLIDARWEAMLPVLEGQVPVIVHADELQQIQAAVAFADQYRLKMILFGAYDAPRCVPLLKKHNIPVIVEGSYRLPLRRSDDYDASYCVADRVYRAGLKYCIASAVRFGASNVRNLPYQAATAAAYGLPEDEAMKAITLYPAQILGVADRVGSLEPGKDATLFIADGNPLETETLVEAAYIQGRAVELSDRHKRLWKKYEEKYRRQAERP